MIYRLDQRSFAKAFDAFAVRVTAARGVGMQPIGLLSEVAHQAHLTRDELEQILSGDRPASELEVCDLASVLGVAPKTLVHFRAALRELDAGA